MAVVSAHKVAKHGGNPLLRAIGFLSSICGVVAAAMIVIAVAITCQMIWVRFMLNQSTVWQTEAVVYMMVAATLIGIPYVQRLRGHVNVDLLPLALPLPLRKALAIVTLVTTIAITAVMVVYGFELWHVAWSRGWTSDTVWAPKLWVPYLALPLGFGLFMLQLIADLVATIFDIEAPFSIDEEQAGEAKPIGGQD